MGNFSHLQKQTDEIFEAIGSEEEALIYIKLLEERYGIQIEKASISKFNGTVEKLNESLTYRINKAIQFQTKHP